MTDKKIKAAELKAGRVALGLTREAVAAAVGVSPPTIKNLELGQVRGKPYRANAELSAKLVTFFEGQGVQFLPDKPGRAFGLDVADPGKG